MIGANLDFKKVFTALNTSAIDLRFGDDLPPSTAVTFNVLATLSSPIAGFQLTLITPVAISALATVSSPTAAVSLKYDINVIRNLTQDSHVCFEQADHVSDIGSIAFQQSVIKRAEDAIGWHDASSADIDNTLHVFSGISLKTKTTTHWQDGYRLQIQSQTVFRGLDKSRLNTQVRWQGGRPIDTSATPNFVDLLPRPLALIAGWAESKYISLIDTFPFSKAISLMLEGRIPWQVTRQPSYVPPSVNPPVIPPYQATANLDFICRCLGIDPLNVRLNFGAIDCANQIFDQKVYFILNTLTLKRVFDNLAIEVFSASIGIDKSSWAWSFNASIPFDQLANVQPTITGPVEVELNINGIIWRLIVEGFSENKQFAKTGVSITGRSKTAYLDNPYAPTRSLNQSQATTSRQMAEAELTRVGLQTGFNVDWQLVDDLGWAMPANTWSYQDLTPIQVIQQIAEGAGGYLNSSPLGDSVIVLPDYKLPFWQWSSATIDKSIPMSLIKSQSLKWTEKPSYNGVFVSGENTGVTGFARRLGTNGEFQAPTFVNPMISAEAAARNKGMSILSSGGKQASIGMELPMHQDLGLVMPGMLIEVTASAPWRGVVRSTSIAASWSGGLTVTQSLELERHYE
jgi:hypothetical protein